MSSLHLAPHQRAPTIRQIAKERLKFVHAILYRPKLFRKASTFTPIDFTIDSCNSLTYGNCLRLDSSSGHQKQPQSQSNQAQPHRTPSQRPPETQTTKPPKRPQESSLGSPIELASNVTCSATAMSDSHVQQGKSTPTSHNCLSSDIAVCRILDASPTRQHLLYISPNPN